jgi:AraC-like DNA-binding protein
MQLNILNVLSILITFQLTLLVIFLLVSSKGKRISNILLGSFFLLLLLNLVDGLLAYHGFFSTYPQYAHLEDGFVFLLGPALYFYSRSLIYKDFTFRKKDLLHIVPFVVLTIIYQTFYHLQSIEDQKLIQSSITHQTLPAGFYFSMILIYGHVATYIFYACREVLEYRKKIRNRFSSVDKINLDWLMFMLGSIAVVLFVSIIYTFLPAVGLREYFQYGFIAALIFIFCFTNAVVWKGMRQPLLFSGLEDEPKELEKKYQSSTLTTIEKDQIKSTLQKLMQDERLFLRPDLTLDHLAESVGVSSKKLSQVINESFHQNFFDYINSFRIEEAQRIFRESKDVKLTVLEVMYQAGFNSKSSFNTIFREKTGQTPSEFKKLVRQ